MDSQLEGLPDDNGLTENSESTTTTINISPPPCGRAAGVPKLSCPSNDNLQDDYSKYLLVLVLFILCLALVMCLARILFMYCGYKRRRFEQPDDDRETARRQEAEEITGHPFSYLATEAGRVNYGFVDPPPRYDQLFKDNAERPAAGSAAIDQAPPTYDEHVTSARSTASANSAAHISVSNIRFANFFSLNRILYIKLMIELGKKKDMRMAELHSVSQFDKLQKLNLNMLIEKMFENLSIQAYIE
ncbi:hypothetical protein WR25_23230 [Diploscapter pachys]|uniref:Uncharacterized protein n=1 Tax=Diploscapter pachys TaxID=2018661 RepID=A0A2A2LA07_9BILA|nr:hypothetical protein WR25_23230 [Diploscapter pachys]